MVDAFSTVSIDPVATLDRMPATPVRPPMATAQASPSIRRKASRQSQGSHETHRPQALTATDTALPKAKRRTKAIFCAQTNKAAPSSNPIPGNGGSAGPFANEAQSPTVSTALSLDGHTGDDSHSDLAVEIDHGGLARQDNLSSCAPVVEEIIQLWRMRQRWHRAEKSLILQGKAVCRSWTAGDKDAANALYGDAASGKVADPILLMALAPFLSAQEPFARERLAIEKRLRKLAQSLPVYPWVKSVKGFGDLNLAALVGECGDIGSYRGPAALWKRMGLAVIEGGRQRLVSDAEAALAHGYNPSRRAAAYLLGDCLVKGNGEGAYRALYLSRKEIEAERVATKAHAHNRAARYMTKRALRDLWAAWRAADGHSCNATHSDNAVSPLSTDQDEAE
jgi:hypothetical protein